MTAPALIITDHAEDRFRRRSGLPRRVVTKSAELAVLHGITADEAAGMLRRYLQSRENGTAIAYCGMVYIFSGPTLVTVYPIPAKLRKIAAKLQQRKKAGL
jgi:2-keto-3-deoxy-galactonokinase